jgi:hypothetical protein
MKTLPKVATEIALHVLAYNLTRVMNIVGVQPLMAAANHLVGGSKEVKFNGCCVEASVRNSGGTIDDSPSTRTCS